MIRVAHRRPGRWAFGLAAALLGLSGCSREGTGPQLPTLEVAVAGGDEQYGTAGTELPQPLRVVVRNADSKLPVSNVTIRWTVAAGDGRLVGPDAKVTDDDGVAETTLRLGSQVGEITVLASVVEQQGASVELRSFLVPPPQLSSVEPSAAPAGATVVLEGLNFSPTPAQNLVFFSEMRGRVLTASETRLEVELPPCLPQREVEARVALGAVSSGVLEVTITEGGPVEPLVPGQFVDLDDASGRACVRLPGDQAGVYPAEYLLIPYTTSTVAGARHALRLVWLPWSTAATTPPRTTGPTLAPSAPAADAGDANNAQAAFESGLRQEEEELLRRRREGAVGGAPGVGPGRAPSGPAAVPDLGASRTFSVFNGSDDPENRFSQVTATARYVGSQGVVYVDDEAPEGGFTDADLQEIGGRFDEVIHPRITDAFGNATDLDGNGRVVILLTPVVNELTPRQSNSFVGGFFYGRDLMPELSGSNGGEIFYALVPDPTGIHGDERPRVQIVSVLPAILAHEFQHMVHYGERVVRGGASQDALWLLEGLAQMAEELVAREYAAAGDSTQVERFQDGNRRRARLFLERPDSVSLIVSSGSGTLAERGAGFLFLLYLTQQHGVDILRDLTQETGLTGVSSVIASTGSSWDDLLVRWPMAVYFDRPDMGGPFSYPDFDLRGFLRAPSPIHSPRGPTRDFVFPFELLSSTMRYIRVVPPEDGTLTLTFQGVSGGPLAAGSGAGLRVVRTF